MQQDPSSPVTVAKTIEGAFENPTYPKDAELLEELSNTELLTKKEAVAFVTEFFASEWRMIPEYFEEFGFDGEDDYEATVKRASDKIAEAAWIDELLAAYRRPDFDKYLPDECSECGGEITGSYSRPKDEEEKVLCPNCVDVSIEDLSGPPF